MGTNVTSRRHHVGPSKTVIKMTFLVVRKAARILIRRIYITDTICRSRIQPFLSGRVDQTERAAEIYPRGRYDLLFSHFSHGFRSLHWSELTYF